MEEELSFLEEKLNSINGELDQFKTAFFCGIADKILETGSTETDIGQYAGIVRGLVDILNKTEEIIGFMDSAKDYEKKQSENKEEIVSLIPLEIIADVKWKKMLSQASVSLQEMEEAYNWAQEFRINNGIKSMNITLDIHDGDALPDSDRFKASLFYDEKSGNTLLRRDWKDSFSLTYNVVANFDEAKKDAPNLVIKMIKNGIELYNEWMFSDGTD